MVKVEEDDKDIKVVIAVKVKRKSLAVIGLLTCRQADMRGDGTMKMVG